MSSNDNASLLQAKAKPAANPFTKVLNHYRSVLIPREVLVVIAWATVVHSNIIQYLVAGFSNSNPTLGNLVLLSFLFTPLMGYLGEKVVRYNLLMYSMVMIIVFSGLYYTTEIIQGTLSDTLSQNTAIMTMLQVVTGIADFFQKFGIQIFTANIIQFGITQLHEAPSSALAAFGRWYIAFYFIPISINFLLSYIAKVTDIEEYMFFSRLAILKVVTISTIPCVHFIFRKRLIIEPKTRTDPIKQIFGILRYAYTSRGPTRERSAFTYGEAPPSKLDQAKQRYGGPYTTEQVENVKTFWRVLVIVVIVMAFTLNQYQSLTAPYLGIVKYNNGTLNPWEVSVLSYPALYRTTMVVCFVLVFQLVYVPLFPRHVPSMLVRMVIGYILVTLSNWLGSVTSIILIKEANTSNLCFTEDEMLNISSNGISNLAAQTTSLILTNAILNGLGNGFTYTASLEFIMAQAPTRMQGLIIGFWYSRLTVQGIVRIIGTSLGCYPEFHFTISAITLLMLILLIVNAYYYNYRQRNESSDVNIRANIEAVFERNLNRNLSTTESYVLSIKSNSIQSLN